MIPPRLTLSTQAEAVTRAYNLILGSPYCQTTQCRELLEELVQVEATMKWVSERDEAALRAVPRKQEGGE